MEDKANGFRPFPLGFDRWGWSLDREEESSCGSSSRDWELPGNWDSSDAVEGVRCEEKRKAHIIMFLQVYREQVQASCERTVSVNTNPAEVSLSKTQTLFRPIECFP